MGVGVPVLRQVGAVDDGLWPVAHGMLALADGLALHAVSTDRWLTADHMDKTLKLVASTLSHDDQRP